MVFTFLFFGACGFLCFLMDGHSLATAVLFPSSLLQGFEEAVMRITLFHSFQFSCSTVYNKRRQYCIYRSQPEAEMSCSVGDRDVLNGWRRRGLIWPEMVMSCMGRDGDMSYGRRWWCLVWADITVDSCPSWWHSAILVCSYIYWPCGPLRLNTINLL